jgi:Fe-S cluster assembly ATP-binding protein
MLHIQNLSVAIQDTIILKPISFSVDSGTISVIQGPNGSGKSTLINTIAGHPSCSIVAGSINLNSATINTLSSHERAQQGLFVILQQQIVIPGLTITTFLYEVYQALKKESVAPDLFRHKIEEAFDFVGLERSFVEKSVCQGFSGGQKKRFELVQLLLFEPAVAVLDEVDSGIDSQGLDIIIKVITHLRQKCNKICFLIVTHNKQLVELLKPDQIIQLSVPSKVIHKE